MSIWSEHDVLETVRAVLREVTVANPDGHHFGRSFLTAYQLAIEVDRRNPRIARALRVRLGGEGTGSHTSLAQYLARELSPADPAGERRLPRGRCFPLQHPRHRAALHHP